MPGVNQATQGRRGYYLYEYGPHLWFPEPQTDFAAGMFRDLARQDIPGNGAYDLADFLVDQPGVVRKRGGSSYQGNTAVGVGGQTGTPSYYGAVMQGYFPGTLGLSLRVAVTDLGDVINLVTPTPVALGPGVVTKDKPKLFIGGAVNMVVITDSTGATIPTTWDGLSAPKKLGASSSVLTVTGTPTGGSLTLTLLTVSTAGTSITNWAATIVFNSTSGQAKTALELNASGAATFTVTGGALPGSPLTITPSTSVQMWVLANNLTGGSSPAGAFTWNTAATNCPAALYSAMHLSRIVLANTTAHPNRIFFSPVPDPTVAWDATSYVDANNPITGLAVVNGNLLVFSRHHLEKYVGDVPPGVNATSTLTHLTVESIGCTDARSITQYGSGCIFANPVGVFQTDGVSVNSLTERKIGAYWRANMASYVDSTWTISTGIFAHRYLHVTVLDASRTIVMNLIYDLANASWVRATNNAALMYGSGDYSSTDELFAATPSTPRALKLSGLYTPTSANKNDADGTAITPLLETRPFGSFPFMGRFGKAHLSYDMRDAASDNPTMAITVAPGTEATTYAAVPESPLAETSDMTRTRFATGKESQALSVKFQQTNASSKTEIYSVEVATRGLTKNAGGQ